MNKRSVGKKYEEMAQEYLKMKGYNILDVNYYCKYGEIDIICEKNGELIFVEVKYRSSLKYGEPIDAVNYMKQRRICKSSMYYVITHKYSENTNCRFDVIGINKENKIMHYENAFEYMI